MKLSPRDILDESKNSSHRKRKRDQAAGRIDAAIKSALDELDGREERTEAFLELLGRVRALTPWLRPAPGRGRPGWVAPVFLIGRLKNLAARAGHWIRPCAIWRPATDDGLRPAFRSLAHHLLACHPVPGFMDSAWDVPAGPEAFRQQSWFIRIGRGTRFRDLNLPFVLTRRMEHHLRRAPDHFTVLQALRYGETRGLGGSEMLAREIAIGRLGEKMQHSGFWRTVLLFFAAQPELKREHVNPIVDFIQASVSTPIRIAAVGAKQRSGPCACASRAGKRGWPPSK